MRKPIGTLLVWIGMVLVIIYALAINVGVFGGYAYFLYMLFSGGHLLWGILWAGIGLGLTALVAGLLTAPMALLGIRLYNSGQALRGENDPQAR